MTVQQNDKQPLGNEQEKLTAEMDQYEFDKIMKKNYYIYCLKLDRNLLNAVAEQMGLMVYHKIGEFHTRFDPREAEQYEPLRDV